MRTNLLSAISSRLPHCLLSAAILSTSFLWAEALHAAPCDCDQDARQDIMQEASAASGIPSFLSSEAKALCQEKPLDTMEMKAGAAAGAASEPDAVLSPAAQAPWQHTGPLRQLRTIRGKDVMSPKSAAFHPDGTRLYVNALEAMKTLVYDASTLEYIRAIDHRFTSADKNLFQGQEDYLDYPWYHAPSKGSRNIFGGKPVEMAFSHGGRYLWVPYYRRSYDPNASCPSAIAVIDTATDSIVRVMPTAPLPKMVVQSPDGKRLAVAHWGDNSVGIYDISSADPAEFRFEKIIYTGPRPNLAKVAGNRDANCGQCVRGTAFTPDSRYLLVGRMHNGGISVIDMQTLEHAGVFNGIAPTPRHMILSKDNTTLYVSSSASGVVTALNIEAMLESVKTKKPYRGREVHVGRQVRTIVLSPDGKAIFAAINGDSRLVRIDAAAMKVTGSVSVPPYAVGAAVSTDGRTIVTTSQGKSGKGGHVLGIYTEAQPQ